MTDTGMLVVFVVVGVGVGAWTLTEGTGRTAMSDRIESSVPTGIGPRRGVPHRRRGVLAQELAMLDNRARDRLANVDVRISRVEDAMLALRPDIGDTPEGREDWNELALAIEGAAREWDIDPMVAVAIAFRESAFSSDVGHGRKRGDLGEVGWFQIYPHGAAQRECGGGCPQRESDCNAATAMCWLARRREECGADPWRWVAAYGRRGRCPSARLSRGMPEVRAARDIYCRLVADCAAGWPG